LASRSMRTSSTAVKFAGGLSQSGMVSSSMKDMPDGYVGHGVGDGRSPCDGGYARHTWVAGSGVAMSAAGWMMPAATSCSR
jgi:hypothetical protein